MGTPTFFLNDVFIAGDVSATWSEEQWRGIINKLLPEGKDPVLLYSLLHKWLKITTTCSMIESHPWLEMRTVSCRMDSVLSAMQ